MLGNEWVKDLYSQQKCSTRTYKRKTVDHHTQRNVIASINSNTLTKHGILADIMRASSSSPSIYIICDDNDWLSKSAESFPMHNWDEHCEPALLPECPQATRVWIVLTNVWISGAIKKHVHAQHAICSILSRVSYTLNHEELLVCHILDFNIGPVSK